MVRKFVKNRPLFMTVIGMLVLTQSIAWEYVRVKPDYRFLIEPWSMRGYELDQGLVLAAGGLVVIALALLHSSGRLKETPAHSTVLAGVLVLFGVIAAIATDAKDVKIPFPIQVILAIIGAVVIRSLLDGYIPDTWNKRRRLTVVGMWLVGFAFTLFAVVGPLLKNEQPFWIFIAVGGVILSALGLFRPPRELAGARMIINGVLSLWVLSMTMSASLRVTLDRAQFDLNGISADVKNIQITSGVLLAWLGGLIAFTGAVGMWAKRRDELITIERIRKQQEAARESEAQLSVTG